jgi:hypothetical protein
MSTLNNQPDNLNFLSSTGYKFFIKKLPTVNFFVQSFNIPGMKLVITKQPTMFNNIDYYGDEIEYSDFNVTFAVDEDLRNYCEIKDWMEGLGSPKGFRERQLLNSKEIISEGKRSDCILNITTNKKNSNLIVTVKDAFPFTLSDVFFQSTATNESFLVATAVFKYLNVDIKKVNT